MSDITNNKRKRGRPVGSKKDISLKNNRSNINVFGRIANDYIPLKGYQNLRKLYGVALKKYSYCKDEMTPIGFALDVLKEAVNCILPEEIKNRAYELFALPETKNNTKKEKKNATSELTPFISAELAEEKKIATSELKPLISAELAQELLNKCH